MSSAIPLFPPLWLHGVDRENFTFTLTFFLNFYRDCSQDTVTLHGNSNSRVLFPTIFFKDHCVVDFDGFLVQVKGLKDISGSFWGEYQNWYTGTWRLSYQRCGEICCLSSLPKESVSWFIRNVGIHVYQTTGRHIAEHRNVHFTHSVLYLTTGP